MNAFYLSPNQAVRRLGAGPATSLALQLWQNPAGQTAQLRVLAARPEPIDVAVYDTTGRVRYHTTTHPNSTLPLEAAAWAAGTYAVRVCQGDCTITRMLVRE